MIEDGHNKAPRRTTLYSGISGLPRPWIPSGMNSGTRRSGAISRVRVLSPKGGKRLTAFLAAQRDIVTRRTSCNVQGRVLRSFTMVLSARRSVSLRMIGVALRIRQTRTQPYPADPEPDANVRFYPLAIRGIREMIAVKRPQQIFSWRGRPPASTNDFGALQAVHATGPHTLKSEWMASGTATTGDSRKTVGRERSICRLPRPIVCSRCSGLGFRPSLFD